MANLTTHYLGLKLDNPLIASSSNLTDSYEHLEQLAQAGIGAIVLKSIFEEQIQAETHHLSETSDFPEANDYIRTYVHEHTLSSYVDLIEKAKKNLHIPIIASINCTDTKAWLDFAARLEQAGADALEINIFILPTNANVSGAAYETHYFEIVEEVVNRVKIPVSIKLSRYFTNPLYILNQLLQRGCKGAVLFNRFYQSEVSLKKMALIPSPLFSGENDYIPTLRWINLAATQMPQLDLAISTGIHSGTSAAKAIAVGAKAVQVCSILYEKGPDYVATLRTQLLEALQTAHMDSVEQLQGHFVSLDPEKTDLFQRSQFMKYFNDFKSRK